MKRPARSLRARLALLTAACVAAPLAVTAAPAQAVVGTPDTSGTSYTHTARIDIGDGLRGCSGTLVHPEWLLTAASCFADDPATSLAVPAGSPALTTVATIGRTDLLTQTGEVRTVVELVPRTDRDVVLARLARPVTNIAPVAISATPPAVGEELRVAGYGRTAEEWSPEKLHVGTFTVDSVSGADVGISGNGEAAVCMGDTGGPALRPTGAGAELVALHSRSHQVGCYGVDAPEGTENTAIDTRVDDLRAWVGSTVNTTRITDFNCDGVEDVAIADPEATVGAHANAGVVRVVHGGGRGTAELTQDLESVPGGAEANDRFGQTLAAFDHNEDGCTDLVVGVPYENLGSAVDAGMVSVLYGAPGGLATGQPALNHEQGAGTGGMAATVSETGDRMGAALAAGHTTAGEPYLLIGVPGEDIEFSGGTDVDAGSVFYLRGAVNLAINQSSAGLGGDPENGDDFGATLAASPQHLAIGVPGEGAGAHADAGGVHVLTHALNAAGVPAEIGVVNQGLDWVGGAAEAGDRFADALAAAPYRPAGSAAATDSFFFVGVPGEDTTVGGTNRADAGGVYNFRVTAGGAITEHSAIWQGADGVTGAQENGDRFGAALAAANLRPSEVTGASDLVVAVGTAGEDIGGVVDAGAIQTFAPLGVIGDTDVWVEPGLAGLPGGPGAGQQVGKNIHATGRHLYVGMPYGPAPFGAMHAVPWANARGGPEPSPVTTHQPGQGGLPAVGVRFGWAMQ
ncbi:trypsin-like serine protease [Streptomyces marincola]|uniref:trypsin-like serine protease n=1 Tax=Streptomyces marincola TaxID=2878388 RepID=UPI001CF4602C|nr:trypsin-like serine protease [Streptomyces marincola]UCM87632.1 trypsin-like serine protease [Streptomyces marincola]